VETYEEVVKRIAELKEEYDRLSATGHYSMLDVHRELLNARKLRSKLRKRVRRELPKPKSNVKTYCGKVEEQYLPDPMAGTVYLRWGTNVITENINGKQRQTKVPVFLGAAKSPHAFITGIVREASRVHFLDDSNAVFTYKRPNRSYKNRKF